MPKPKKVSYELIPPKSEAGKVMYRLLNELVKEHHDDIRDARIALAWNISWKPDVDGRVTLGKCKKASDLDRELMAFDFVILLRREFWEDGTVTDAQRAALLDHELCHATVKYSTDNEPVIDERDRKVYRIRKHDIEEFAEIIERHGLYKRDLEWFAAALRRAKQTPLLNDEPTAPTRDAYDRLAASVDGRDVTGLCLSKVRDDGTEEELFSVTPEDGRKARERLANTN